MTVQLEWPAEVIARLTEEAQKKGLSLDEYVLQTMTRTQLPTEAESKRRAELQRVVDDIRKLQKENTLGTDLTIRDLIEEGRRF